MDEVLSAPEIARVLDRALAGSLPEEIARSLVRHRVLERIAAELAASGELERLVTAALATPKTLELTDKVLASDETQRVLRTSPRAPSSETRSPGRRRGSPRRWSRRPRVRRSARRPGRAGRAPPARTERPIYAGIATRAIALATDAAMTVVVFMSIVGIVGLVASLVGGLRPEWLVGALLASGWLLVVGTYFVLFWSAAGQTPGMRLLRMRVVGPRASRSRSVDRSCAWSGSCSRSCRCSPASCRCCSPSGDAGCTDFLAGTVVLYDDPRP